MSAFLLIRLTLVGIIPLQALQIKYFIVLRTFNDQIDFHIDPSTSILDVSLVFLSLLSHSKWWADLTEKCTFLVGLQTSLSSAPYLLFGILQIFSVGKIWNTNSRFHSAHSSVIRSLIVSLLGNVLIECCIAWVKVEGIYLSWQILILCLVPTLHNAPSLIKSMEENKLFHINEGLWLVTQCSIK